MIEAGDSFGAALAKARAGLGGSPTPQLDARVLLEEAAKLSRAELIAADHQPIGPLVAERFRAFIERRQQDEPVAYILGRQEFYGRDFAVGPGVLIPRPETEMLVEAATGLKPSRVLDLGTGSGCLLLSILREVPAASGVGIDVSAEALRYAERNLSALGLGARAALRRLAFAEAPLTLRSELFDVIVANPPYVAHGAALPASVARFEPETALYAGDAGLASHREVAAAIASLLAPSGSAFVEIGYDQEAAAKALYAEMLPGRDVQTRKDAAGHPRMVAVGPKAGL